ncbi:MAG: metallophosphatase [Saprospiraceae bacterium]|nr:metallophosphatase [Saprospiraceae bacterium]
MKEGRRKFIEQLGMGGFLLTAGKFPWQAWTGDVDVVKITILHTNDVHSRIDPFPMDGSRNAGLGGAAKRAAMIKRIRKANENILLFDSGDIFQGTPYFNFYGGELEMKLMTEMGYDAATMGNHDFDGGIDGFVNQLKHANFDILMANYNFDNTPMQGKSKPYKVFEKQHIRIGVFGLGIELDGLVPQKLYGDTQYNDPVKAAMKTSAILKHNEKCDYVICLSHLGYRYDESKVSDVSLARESKDIDLILGGHTHTFLKEPTIVENMVGKPVTINQAGWAGILLGNIDLYFERNKKGKCVSCKNITVK